MQSIECTVNLDEYSDFVILATPKFDVRI